MRGTSASAIWRSSAPTTTMSTEQSRRGRSTRTPSSCSTFSRRRASPPGPNHARNPRFRRSPGKGAGILYVHHCPGGGTHLYGSTTFKLSKVPFPQLKPPVRLGEDNDYVYREVLKISEEEYDKLKALGQIGMDYAPHVT